MCSTQWKEPWASAQRLTDISRNALASGSGLASKRFVLAEKMARGAEEIRLSRVRIWICLIVFLMACLFLPTSASAAEAAHDEAKLGAELPVWTVVPFVAMLAAIAVMPLAAGHWWEHNRN